MSARRRSYESGHNPKCLVVIDDTPESDRALYFATRWAARMQGGVVMLRVIDLHDSQQQWLGVADIMKAEATEDANAALDRAVNRIQTLAPVPLERVIREGDAATQIHAAIDGDLDIATLVLAAGTGSDGPGPIIAGLAKTLGTFPIPITIVPGGLIEADLDALS